MNAKAAAAPMTMGVSVAISRRLIRLPAHYNNSLALNCSCCDHYHNCKVNFVSTMYLVVEILLFFPFTAQQLFDDGRLRDEDAFVLYTNWLSDQLTFFHHFGRMHVDGHLGNILISNNSGVLDFVWNDFGRSTTKTERKYGSKTIGELQWFAQTAVEGFIPHPCLELDLDCVTKSLNVARNFTLYQKLAVERRLVAGLLAGRVSNLENQVDKLREDNATQAAEITELRADNVAQSAEIATQAARILDLFESVGKLQDALELRKNFKSDEL